MKDFDKFIIQPRQESSDILSIANNEQNIYKSLTEVPTEKLKEASENYRKSKCAKVE
jgi:hypothetical protein